jgi:hypothetical protein
MFNKIQTFEGGSIGTNEKIHYYASIFTSYAY